jgi:hypothetical protein
LFSPVPLAGPYVPGINEHTISRAALLAACQPTQRDALCHELGIIKAITAKGIAAGRTGANATTWDIWHTFCCSLYLDPGLADIDDPIPLLQIFAHRYRTGLLAPSGAQVRARTVEGALRAVGQAFSTLGQQDPRLLPSGKLDIRLSRQLLAYKKEDPPPCRVKPIPFPVLAQAITLCHMARTPAANAIADMLLLGFFFLLRPGEYAYTHNPDADPFRLCNVHLLINSRRLDPITATEHELHRVNYVALEFTTQKNGVRGELVGLGRTGHPIHCPVIALTHRVTHLRTHRAPPITPLYSYYDTRWQRVDTTTLTMHLRHTVTACGAQFGITAIDVSIRSLRSSGAMSLLCAKVDTDTIRLLGRWRSDEMMRYLHVQAFPLLAPLAAQMLHHGHFSLMPNHPIGDNGGAAGTIRN